jgi:hypothetical protein
LLYLDIIKTEESLLLPLYPGSIVLEFLPTQHPVFDLEKSSPIKESQSTKIITFCSQNNNTFLSSQNALLISGGIFMIEADRFRGN